MVPSDDTSAVSSSQDVTQLVRRLSDESDIRRLVQAYGFAIDAHDGVTFAHLFTEDGELELPKGVSCGWAALSKVVTGFEHKYPDTMHLMANHLVELHGDDASGQVYGVARHRHRRGAEEVDVAMPLHYKDTYVRTPGGWKFRTRVVTIKWQEEIPLFEPTWE
jgi:hypothetical protein